MDHNIIDLVREHLAQLWYRNRLLGLLPEHYGTPTGVQLEITYRCNLRCRHCYNESGAHIKEFARELTQSQWLAVAREIVDLGVFSVVISGGEPFLRPSLVLGLVDILHDADVRMGIVTNGWLLDRETVQSLAAYRKNINWVQVSVDGATSDVHDHIRGVKGSFDRATRAIASLRREGLPVKMASAIMPDNDHQIEDLFELALFLGVTTLHLGTFFNIGAGRTLNVTQKWKDACIERVGQSKTMYESAMEVLVSMDPFFSVQLFSEHRLNNAFIVRPNGEIKLDCAVPVIFGEYSDPGDLRRIWQESGLQDAYRNTSVRKVIDRIMEDGGFQNIHDVVAENVSIQQPRHEQACVVAN